MDNQNLGAIYVEIVADLTQLKAGFLDDKRLSSLRADGAPAYPPGRTSGL
jgi:hypothetical protein